jgi:chromosome segregation ATPase
MPQADASRVPGEVSAGRDGARGAKQGQAPGRGPSKELYSRGTAAAQLAEIKKECRHLRLAASERSLAESECAEIDRDMDKLNASLDDLARKIAAEETRSTELAQLLEEKESAVASPVKARMDDPATLQRTVDQLKRRNASLVKALSKYADPKLGQQEEEGLAATLLQIAEAEKERALAESNLRRLSHQVNQQQRVAQTADLYSSEKRAEMTKTHEAYLKRLEEVLARTSKSKQASLDRAASLEHEWARWLQLLTDVADRVQADAAGSGAQLAEQFSAAAAGEGGARSGAASKRRPAAEAGITVAGAVVLDALRQYERQQQELKKKGAALVQEEKQLDQRLEAMRKSIAAQRSKLAPGSPVASLLPAATATV